MRSHLARVLSRRFATDWALMFASCVGVLSGVVALLPRIDLDFTRSTLILLSCSLIAICYAWKRSQSRHLPVDELFPEILTPEASSTLECATERSIVAQVSRMAHDIFSNVESIPLDRYEQWLMVNENILVCLLDRDRQVIGYFDVFPLTEDFAKNFIEGIVGEKDIRREHILRPREARAAKYLYLAGLAVVNPDSVASKRNAGFLLWGLVKYLEHFYGIPSGRQLLVVPSTVEGEKLAKRFRLQLLQAGDSRRDPYPIYATELSLDFMQLVTANLGDWTSACGVGWLTRRRSSRIRAA